LPVILGFGMTTLTPGRARSAQSRIAFGLPLRTMMTVIELVGAALCGSRFAQSAGSRPLSATMSISSAWFIVMTSASRPSMTARAL